MKKIEKQVIELSDFLKGKTVKDVSLISGLPVITFENEDRELNSIIITRKEVRSQLFIRNGQKNGK